MLVLCFVRWWPNNVSCYCRLEQQPPFFEAEMRKEPRCMRYHAEGASTRVLLLPIVGRSSPILGTTSKRSLSYGPKHAL